MGKQILIFIFLVALLIFTGMWEQNYLEDTSNYLKSDIDYIMYEIENNNFDEAKSHMKELRNTWKDASVGWNILLNHDRLDEFEETMENLDANIYLKNKEESIRTGKVLKAIVSQIVDKQRISFEHVF